MFKNKKEKKDEFDLGFKRFIKELKKRKKESIIIIILLLLSIVPGSFGPLIIGKIIDSLINNSISNLWGYSIESVWVFLSLLAFIAITWRTATLFLYHYKEPKLSASIFKSYYIYSFSKIIYFPVTFFKNNPLGKITHSIEKGSESLGSNVRKSIDLLHNPVSIIVYSFIIFFISWKVLLLLLFTSFLFFLHLKLSIKKRKKVNKDFNDSKKNISAFVSEKINFALEVKKNFRDENEISNIKKIFIEEYEKKFLKVFKFNLKNFSLIFIIFWLSIITLWLLLIFLYKKNELGIGDVVALSGYSTILIKAFGNLVENINKYIESFILIGDTEKLLQNIPENYSVGKTRKNVEGEIEFKNVNFGYEDEGDLAKPNPADTQEKILKNTEAKNNKKTFSLSNINLKIKKGSKVAFVGESGGGKSTSVELIGGFYFPEKGNIFIDGVSTKDINLNDLRGSIAYVSQDIAIFNTTIGENISYGLNEGIKNEEEIIKKVKEAAKLANIKDFIESLPDGYNTKVGEKGLKLSGGQKQRIAIARAILRNPKILILDEPTSALDIQSETKITTALKKIMEHRTTIIIAHRISTVRNADNIFVFQNGKIIEEGNYQSLISQKGEFNKMLELHKGLD